MADLRSKMAKHIFLKINIAIEISKFLLKQPAGAVLFDLWRNYVPQR